MIGVHQAGVGGDNAMTVGVGVVAGDNIKVIFVPQHRCHCRLRRGIHSNLAIPVERHETPGGIDRGVNNRDVEAEAFFDERPIVHACTPERVGTNAHPGTFDSGHVDDVLEVVDIVAAKIVGSHGHRLGPLHLAIVVENQLVRPIGDPVRGIAVGRPAVRRVVFEAAIAGRIVAWGDHNSIGEICVPARVVGDDRMAERGSRHEVVKRINQHVDSVGHEHLERRRFGRSAESMGVAADEERPGDALPGSILHNRLGDRGNVGFVEGAVEA